MYTTSFRPNLSTAYPATLAPRRYQFPVFFVDRESNKYVNWYLFRYRGQVLFHDQ